MFREKAINSNENPRPVLSRSQVAEYLGVCLLTVDRLLRDEKISHSRVGRRVVFTQQDVDEYIARNRRPARV